jgi:hypothetical protein
MTRAADLLDIEEEGIRIAVDPDIMYALIMTGSLPL